MPHPPMDLSLERLKLSDGDGGGEDRLSALPNDLLISILLLVDDAPAAARTSILASRWRRLWALLPELRFFSIEHRRIGAALAAHEAPDLSLLVALTEDASPESVSAWLPFAARGLSGSIFLGVFRFRQEAGERGGAVDLPCFEKATSIKLTLGFLGLTLPPSGVFARLKVLYLIDIQLHGQSGLGDLLSSQRCPSLGCLCVCNVRGLESLNIQSDSLLKMELSELGRLQQLNVVAPTLDWFKVSRCFTDPLNPELSVANISAPQLTMLDWKNVYDPCSIHIDKMAHLEKLGIELFILEEDEEAAERNQYGMTLLRRFDHIHTLDVQISYPQEICIGPYLMEGMPTLPGITILTLGIMAYGHSFGGSSFDIIRRCTGVKQMAFDFTLGSQVKVILLVIDYLILELLEKSY
uniref:Uncharacterized protein n=1 Tax=Avena sativa TaxID=4498 RepID=A0ACD5VP73_AVESA